MKTYKVEEISILFNVNKETVRRWIRSGELNAIIESKKIGHKISEEDLILFAKIRPGYRSILEKVLGINIEGGDINNSILQSPDTKLYQSLTKLILQREELFGKVIALNARRSNLIKIISKINDEMYQSNLLISKFDKEIDELTTRLIKED